MNQTLTKRKKLKLESDSGWGYAFIAVALIAFSLFTAYPVINAFIISLQKYGPLGSTFVGVDNFVNSFSDELFWKALKNTLVYTLLTVPFNILLSFLISILIIPFKKKHKRSLKHYITCQP